MIRRIKPYQDTYIVSSSTGEIASFGGDEILELGKCSREGSVGVSRILVSIPTNLGMFDRNTNEAILHLKCAYAENLPDTFELGVCALTNWSGGVGHSLDNPGNPHGATWTLPYGVDSDETWDGGVREDEELTVLNSQIFQKGDCLDLNVNLGNFLGPIPFPRLRPTHFLIEFVDEDLAEALGSRLCYYSVDTHTIYSPYVEVAQDDSVHENSGSLDTLDGVIVGTRNLKEHYYTNEQVRIDLSVKPEFPVRVFSTSSLYRDLDEALPESTVWGIRDEYTGEMAIPFNDLGTRVSYDTKNFIILDTSLLEPERYYRLLIKGPSKLSPDAPYYDGRRILDTKNIFRITR